MANNPKQPLVGELSVDATDLTFLVDLEPGARQGLRSSQPGMEAAIQEIKANQSVYGNSDIVPQSTFDKLMTIEERIAMIDARLPATRKLVEMMEETRSLYDDQRERLISAVANIAEAQAKAFGDGNIAARYQETRAYRSAAALKAARTRRRNQEEQEVAEAEAAAAEAAEAAAGQPVEATAPSIPANDSAPSEPESNAGDTANAAAASA